MSFNLYNKDDSLTITDFTVVLDLDLTLICSQDEFNSFKDLGIINNPKLLELKQRSYCIKLTDLEKPGDGSKYDFWGLRRPFTDEFLLFCFNYFKYVIVFSAGEYNYVHSIVDVLFKRLRRPHLILTRDDLVAKSKKPLTKIVNSEFGKSHHIKLNQMITIDDNEEAFVKNVKNAIHIPPFEPTLTIDSLSQKDNQLLKVKYFLLQPVVRSCQDVTKLDFSKVFNLEPDDYKKLANLNK